MGRAVGQFKKEASLSLGTGVENVAWNCMGHAVRQLEKRSYSFNHKQNWDMLHRAVWDTPSASWKKEVSFNQKQN